MDPVSQAALGAAAAQSAARGRKLRAAAVVGALGGMAPDLDVLIRSSEDPLLFLEYHRQFTHALIFIPVGGFIVAMVVHALFARRWLGFRETWLFCTLGYATHGLLDACTSYGTMLLWPFTNERFAWNLVSVIDPLYTVPLLACLAWALWRRRRAAVACALAWALVYPGLGLIQRERAVAEGLEQARARGHEPTRIEAKPSFANIVLWKIVYEADGRFYVDTVRAGRALRFFPGESVPRLDPARDLAWLDPASQQARDVARFQWFSNDYLALHPDDPLRVIDMRYSIVPNEIEPLWAIRLDPGKGPAEHVDYVASRDVSDERLQRFERMLLDRQL